MWIIIIINYGNNNKIIIITLFYWALGPFHYKMVLLQAKTVRCRQNSISIVSSSRSTFFIILLRTPSIQHSRICLFLFSLPPSNSVSSLVFCSRTSVLYVSTNLNIFINLYNWGAAEQKGTCPLVHKANHKIVVHRCEPGVSMLACHAAGPSSILGRDKFPGWGFFGVSPHL